MPTRRAPSSSSFAPSPTKTAVVRLDAEQLAAVRGRSAGRASRADARREDLGVEEAGELRLGPERLDVLAADGDQPDAVARARAARAASRRRRRAARGSGGCSRAGARRRPRSPPSATPTLGERVADRRRCSAGCRARPSGRGTRPAERAAVDRLRACAPPPRGPSRSASPRGRRSPPVTHAPRSTSHARRTSSSVVRALPIARRMHVWPRSAADATNSSPVAVAARASSSLSASTWRKQTVENGCGATTSQPGSASTHDGEELREPDVLADQRAQPFGAVPAQHEPQLQRAEAAAERRPVVLEVDGVVGRGEVVGRRARTSRGAPRGAASRTPSSPSA